MKIYLSGGLFCLGLIAFSHAYAEMAQEQVLPLLKKFAPLVRLHKSEDYFPSSVEWYINRSHLVRKSKENRSKVSLISGTLQYTDISSYVDEDYAIVPAGDRNSILETFKGEPIRDNQVSAPCYAHLVEKPNGAVIQYIFFYPYNGELFGFLDLIGSRLGFGIGAHQGDWEHIDVHLIQSEGDYRIDQVYFARHRASRDGSYASAAEIQTVDSTHPVVYSSLHGHASYPKSFSFVNIVADRTSENGAQWKCWDQIVDIGQYEKPNPNLKWLSFGGTWGLDGPRTPSYQAWWRSQTDRKKSILTVPILLSRAQNGSTRVSESFSLKGKIPTYIKKLSWHLEGKIPAGVKLAINHARVIAPPVRVYGPFQEGENITEVSQHKRNLYVSVAEGMSVDLITVEDVKLVIEGLYE